MVMQISITIQISHIMDWRWHKYVYVSMVGSFIAYNFADGDGGGEEVVFFVGWW